jgi:hypothetical protein
MELGGGLVYRPGAPMTFSVKNRIRSWLKTRLAFGVARLEARRGQILVSFANLRRP